MHRPAARRRRRHRRHRDPDLQPGPAGQLGRRPGPAEAGPRRRRRAGASSRRRAGTLGPDGVYAKGTVRLAAEVPVRGDVADRVKMVDLIACPGPRLRDGPRVPAGRAGTSRQRALHSTPTTSRARRRRSTSSVFRWDGSGADPANGPLANYTSSQITDAEHPDDANIGGFSDPAFDRLHRGRERHLRPGRPGAPPAAGPGGAGGPGAGDLPVGLHRLTTVSAPRSRPSTGRSTSRCPTGPGSRSGWWSLATSP